jgi:hypothetical protein
MCNIKCQLTADWRGAAYTPKLNLKRISLIVFPLFDYQQLEAGPIVFG